MVPCIHNDPQLTLPGYRPPQGVAPCHSDVLTVSKDALNTIIDIYCKLVTKLLNAF